VGLAAVVALVAAVVRSQARSVVVEAVARAAAVESQEAIRLAAVVKGGSLMFKPVRSGAVFGRRWIGKRPACSSAGFRILFRMASTSKLPPPGHPTAPNYWMWETSGHLADAVEQYLDDANACTLRQLALLRAYFKQWVDSPVWDMNPSHDEESRAELARLRLQCDGITNVADMRAWIAAAIRIDIDPL